MNGKYVPKADIPSLNLKVVVAVGQADHFADPTKLSIYRDYKIMYDITAGRIGGASVEDNICPDPAA